MGNIVFQNGLVSMALDNEIAILSFTNGRYNRISNPEFIGVNELDELIRKYGIKALVITGEGKNFSAGADISKFEAYKEDIEDFKKSLNDGKKLLSYIENLPILTVAVLTGSCFGAGFEIALSCQFRFANEKTLLAFPESNLGLLPGMGGTVRLTKLVGKAKALEWILSGEIIGAEEACQLGIIQKIIPKKQELESSLSWIRSILANKGKKQIEKIITALNDALSIDEKTAYAKETDAFAELLADTKFEETSGLV